MSNQELPIVTKEQGLKLKKLGFDLELSEYYLEHKTVTQTLKTIPENHNETPHGISAPTVALALKWVRDKHSVYSNIITDTTANEILGFLAQVVSWKFYPKKYEVFLSYEEAESNCLDVALDYLLKTIVKPIIDLEVEQSLSSATFQPPQRQVIFPSLEEMNCPKCDMITAHELKDNGRGDLWTCIYCKHQLK